jgi:hypothetical protein
LSLTGMNQVQPTAVEISRFDHPPYTLSTPV